MSRSCVRIASQAPDTPAMGKAKYQFCNGIGILFIKTKRIYIVEYFWYIIASIGAGVGTGLAGLSAATVIVPILIVLCPSFHQAGGVYAASAIALASDVIGSALTAAIYAKNKNIDLKKGSVMFFITVIMSIAGSVVAARRGNNVLGNFTLFATLIVGVRFLLNPGTATEYSPDIRGRLSKSDIIFSVIWGTGIGFGIGFLGSGGGMMMLIVFTAFLHMDRKTAVGTSTFTMTFTALIAALSHMFINPSILSERMGALVTCITVTTIASVAAAKFANHVDVRASGLVTGLVLTVLALGLLLLHYRLALVRAVYHSLATRIKGLKGVGKLAASGRAKIKTGLMALKARFAVKAYQ